MDLRDNTITIGELLKNAQAGAILKREFPELANPLMLSLARRMPLAEVLALAKGRVAPERVEAALAKLREL